MKQLWFFLGLMPMVGCAIVLPPTMTYLPDGRRGYTIECSESLECYQQAGWVCGGRGYEIAAAIGLQYLHPDPKRGHCL